MPAMKTRQIPEPRPAWMAVPALLMVVGLWALVAASDDATTDVAAFEHAAHEVAIDPCTLVTAEEVAHALGAVGAPKEAPGMHVVDGQRTCWYPAAGPGKPGLVVGVLDVWGGPYLDHFEATFGEDLVRLEHLADDARWLARARLVLVARSDALLTVQVLDPGGDRDLAHDQAVGLATLAAGRL